MIVALMIVTELLINAITNGYPSILQGNIVSVVIVMVLGYYGRVILLNNQSSIHLNKT